VAFGEGRGLCSTVVGCRYDERQDSSLFSISYLQSLLSLYVHPIIMKNGLSPLSIRRHTHFEIHE
jgi:hypothetical protein